MVDVERFTVFSLTSASLDTSATDFLLARATDLPLARDTAQSPRATPRARPRPRARAPLADALADADEANDIRYPRLGARVSSSLARARRSRARPRRVVASRARAHVSIQVYFLPLPRASIRAVSLNFIRE